MRGAVQVFESISFYREKPARGVPFFRFYFPRKSECAGVYKNKKNGYQTGLNEIRFKLCQTPRASLLRPQTRNRKKHKPKKAASEVETAFLKSYLTRDSNPEPID